MKVRCTLLFLILCLIQTNAQTKIIAHRGFSAIAPENTLIAFEKAIESGAEYFELDVHKSSDGELFVIHDYSIDRTSSNGEKGEVSEMTSSRLKKIRVGYPKKFGKTFKKEKIPTLDDALMLAKGKIKVCIEIKVYGIEKSVMNVVRKYDMEKEVVILSFFYPILTKIRQLSPTIPVLYLKDEVDSLTVGYVKLINVNVIGAGYKTKITKELLDIAHKQGVEIWKWTINDKTQMKVLIKMGLDGLITNYPDKALEIRRKTL